MKLYGALASPYVARVVLFAKLKGLDLTPEMPQGGIKTPEYLAKNPMGKMPVLEADGLAIPESEVICEYLEDAFPGRGGLTGTQGDRARARLLARVFDIYVAPNTGVLFRNMNPASRDEAAVGLARQGLQNGFGYIEHLLVASPYAAGATLSLADCTLAPSFAILKKTAFPAHGIADPTLGDGKLGRWWSTVAADPVVAPFLAEYGVAVDGFLKALAGGR